MVSGTQTQQRDDKTACARILTSRPYRLTLYQLLEHGPFSEQTLAQRLTESLQLQPHAPSELSERSRPAVLMKLRQQYLPVLESVGWVTRCSGRVAIDTTFSLDPDDIRTAALRKPDDPAWEAEAVILGQPYLNSAVAIIATTALPLTLDELASELAARGDTGGYGPTTLRTRLHHTDLPKLDEADVVSYSADRKVITADGPVTPFQSHGVTHERVDE